MRKPCDGVVSAGLAVPLGILDRMPRHRLRYRRSGWAILVALCALLVAGCTGTPDTPTGPDQQIAAFTGAWERLQTDEAATLTSDAAGASLLLDNVTRNLAPDTLTITPGPISRTSADTATTTVTFSWVLPHAGTWTYPATWTWRNTGGGGWLLDWSPTVIHPKLGERQTIATKISSAPQGAMVDRNNQQLVTPVRVYSVVLLPGQVPDVAATAAALAPLLAPFDPGITADGIVAGAAEATAEATAASSPAASPAASSPAASSPSASSPAAPTRSGSATVAVDPASIQYTVINLREDDYKKVKQQLDAIPGLSFPSEVRNLGPTKDFAKALLAEVNQATAERITGTDGWKVITVDSTGGALESLQDVPAVPGQRVVLTLDSVIQQAAEASLTKFGQPAVLLAMQASTGEILAVAQNAAANAQGMPALTGQYPPGSTFKVVTATAALERDLIAPGREVDCPGSTVIEGREIHNAHNFALGTVDSTLAFARSCNTTFANLASQMPADALTTAAKDYGIGLDFVVDGITTLTGKVPNAASGVQRAENGFGQGTTLITPFSAVLLAATAANGTMPTPVLIRGTTTTSDAPAPARAAPIQQAIQQYMAAVVDEGTGTGLQGFGDVHAKTGTAEFTADDGTIHAHAWTVGYRGDLAFAALIVGGEDSAFTNQVVEAFLGAVPAS